MQTISVIESQSPALRTADRATTPERVMAMQTLAQYQIIRRNGAVVPFEPGKIAVAMMKAFLDRKSVV